PGPYLGLTRPRGAHLGLAAAVGVAGFLAANAVMGLWTLVVPHSWIERFDVSRLFDAPLSQQLGIALVATVLAPVCEETAFRGYLLRTIGLRRGPAVAIVTSALLFATLHLDPVRFPALALLGAIFGWMAWRAGSIWPAILAHAVNNGLASAGALASEAGESAAEAPPAGALAVWLLLGGGALALLLRSFARRTPAPPPLTDGLVRIDPADASLRFRVRRLPPLAWAAAWIAAGLLVALTLAGQGRPHRAHPPSTTSAPGSGP
ncbi:MAG TPA: CPBP family intramembrane glutamic endopeptidase, partial [Anaeromyxobacter sp.]|nr:CPBP family intramembrane glutamic endopeptidase [Anaeromyxobacter sp.]